MNILSNSDYAASPPLFLILSLTHHHKYVIYNPDI